MSPFVEIFTVLFVIIIGALIFLAVKVVALRREVGLLQTRIAFSRNESQGVSQETSYQAGYDSVAHNQGVYLPAPSSVQFPAMPAPAQQPVASGVSQSGQAPQPPAGVEVVPPAFSAAAVYQSAAYPVPPQGVTSVGAPLAPAASPIASDAPRGAIVAPSAGGVACTDVSHSQTREFSSPKSFENMIGKNVLGVLASALVFFGLVFFGVLVVPYLEDIIRCLLMYLLSFALTAAGVVLTLRKKTSLSIALLGCGCGSVFISILVTYLYFHYFNDITAFGLLLVWMVGCFILLKKFSSLLLALIVHGGMIVSICLAYAQGFSASKMLLILGYQVLASVIVVGGSAFCYRRTYRFGLFVSLVLTFVASCFMQAYFNGVYTSDIALLPSFLIILAVCLQIAGASVLSFLLSVSTMKLENSAKRPVAHIFNKLLWVTTLCSNIFFVVVKLNPENVVESLKICGLSLAPYGTLPLISIYICLVCFAVHSFISVLLSERLNFARDLSKVSVLFLAIVAGLLLLRRYILRPGAILIMEDGMATSFFPSFSLMLLIAIFLYLLARIVREDSYAFAAHIFLLIDALLMFLPRGYYDLVVRINVGAAFIYMAILLALVFVWWLGLAKEKRSKYLFPTFFSCLIMFEMSFAAIMSFSRMEYKTEITSIVLMVIPIILFLVRFEDRIQASSSARTMIRINEYFLMACCLPLIAFNGRIAAGVLSLAFLVLYLIIAALVLFLLALRMHNAFWHKVSEPAWAQVVSGLMFTLLCFAVIQGTTNLFEQEFVASILCMVTALLCVVLGFTGRLKPLRLYGLVLTLICVLKLVVIDINAASTPMRVVAFIGGGLICFAISALYNYAVKKFDKEVE